MQYHLGPPNPVRPKPRTARQRVAVSCSLLSTFALVLFTNALFALPAHAASRDGITADAGSGSAGRIVRVSYRDLDLSQPRHVAVLRNRLKTAARQLCHATPEMTANDEWFPPTCYVGAVADGQHQIDRAVTDALYHR